EGQTTNTVCTLVWLHFTGMARSHRIVPAREDSFPPWLGRSGPCPRTGLARWCGCTSRAWPVPTGWCQAGRTASRLGLVGVGHAHEQGLHAGVVAFHGHGPFPQDGASQDGQLLAL